VNADGPTLQAQHLTRVVGAPNRNKTTVDDFSYSFESGKIYTILGPSGAGKTSLLRLLNRLDEPTGGEVVFEGKDYRSYEPCKLRSRIGYLFQVPHLFPGTVVDNLRFARPDLDQARIEKLLKQVSIRPEMADQRSDSLSVGEKQRVALARLLSTDPSVVLLDEPTAALDPTYTSMIEKVIKQIAQEQELAIVMVSHEPQQAVRMGGDGLLLVEGRLVEHGPAGDLVERPSTEPGKRYRDRELS
jgi:putative ABC transport system ATP-binding protein